MTVNQHELVFYQHLLGFATWMGSANDVKTVLVIKAAYPV